MLTNPFFYNIFCDNSKKCDCKCSNYSKQKGPTGDLSDEESTDEESDNEDNQKKPKPKQEKPEKKQKKTKEQIYNEKIKELKKEYIEKTKKLKEKFTEYYSKIKDKTSNEVLEAVSNHQCGFKNYGCTCYFNSAMQNLIHNKELIKAILDYVPKIQDKGDIEIIAFYYLIVKIYQEEEERKKNNKKDPVIKEELGYLRYCIALKGIDTGKEDANRIDNFLNPYRESDSQELLYKLIDDIKTILGDDNLNIFDIYDYEEVKCSNDKHKRNKKDQFGTIKQYKFLENIKQDDSYKSINEFLNNPIVETLRENEGSDCIECIKDDLKTKNINFYTNIENEYKKISDCKNCKTIYEGLNDKEKPTNGGYISKNGNIIQHCEICDKIYNSKCQDCKEAHKEMCEDIANSCSKNQRKNKTIKLKSVNNYLIIHLARFKDIKNKINDEIEFEEKLNLNLNGKNENFDLVGIICHTGNPDSGHYYSFNKIGNKWYKFNDRNVSEVPNNKILNAPNIKSLNYVLFYKKQ